VWSKRFEQPIVLRSPERLAVAGLALLTWLPAGLGILLAPIPRSLRGILVPLLVLAIGSEMRAWSRWPERMIWRPGTGWTLEWRDGTRCAGRLLGSSRVLPRILALSWSLPGARRIHMLVLRRAGDATARRRLRVLVRLGRADG